MGIIDDQSRPNRSMREVVKPAAHERPFLGGREILLYLWRSKWLMAVVFVPVFFLGLSFAYLVPVPYQVSSTLRLSGPEQGPSLSDGLIASEARTVLSRPVIVRALGHFPLARIYPDLAEVCQTQKIAPSGETQADARSRQCSDLVVQQVQRDAGIIIKPGARYFDVVYQHRDVGVAEEVLNAIIGAYLNGQPPRETDLTPEEMSPQRAILEVDLQQAEAEILAFFEEHGMTSYDLERAQAGRLYQDASTDHSQAALRLAQVEGELEVIRRELQSIPKVQDIAFEDPTPTRLLDLKLEREDLLSRYRPDSKIIRDFDERISRLETYLKTDEGRTAMIRRGPNPLYQDIEASRTLLAAEASALKKRLGELDRRVGSRALEVNRLQELEPEYRALQRNRDVLETALRQSSVRELASMQELERGEAAMRSEARAYTVEVVDRAVPPVPVDGRRDVFMLIAAVTAICISLALGFVRALGRRSFPTAHALSRTLNLPVLAAVRRYR